MTARLKCYIPFVSNEIKAVMAYKYAFFLRWLSNFLTAVVTYYLWSAIYASSPSPVLAGFTAQEMSAYVIVSFFTTLIVSTSSGGIWQMARDITDGSIAMNLLKPINYQGICISRSLGTLSVDAMIFGFPFLILFAVTGLLPVPSAEAALLYVASILLSFLVLYFFSFCFATLAFYTTYYFGINIAKDVLVQFFSGSLIPLAFFPPAIGNVLRILPFASVNYTPVMIYLGKVSGREALLSMGLQAAWIAALWGMGQLIWRHVTKRLVILGG